MYKKRIKDWAIDKNLKSDRFLNTPRVRQQRDATHEESQPSVRDAVNDAQGTSNYIELHPLPARQFQDGILPPAGEDRQRRYTDPAVTLPPQQRNDVQRWSSASQFHDDNASSPSLPQDGQVGDQVRTWFLLSSIRHRFLAASDTILRRDTTRLFDILNPAYEAISELAETEAEELLSVVVDLFELLHRRSNHQDMLRQLLHYVFTLIPEAVRQNHFLSRNSQVLSLLKQPDSDSSTGVSLDLAGATDSTVAAPRRDCYEQPCGAGPSIGIKFEGDYTYSF
ncbi:hypothetical protein Daus18300_004281 [Diaporthe australafricana]|uniref:Clr5 domain-containing protein n=1 Tax=Diaporthe australafricana TaxID=127596 RepID=A0ABR3XA70_9PEZI